MGVSERGEMEISFSKALALNLKGEEKEKAECFGGTILLLIALAVSVVQNMTLLSLNRERNTGD